MAIDRHIKPRQDFSANLYMFGASTLALFAWSAAPDTASSSPTAASIAVALALVAILGVGLAFRAYWKNYVLRKSWEEAQSTYQEKDDRLISEEERRKIGMREPIGRLYGTTLNGRPTFLPNSIKPAFEFILGGQGTGKTTTQVIASTILTALTSGKAVFVNDSKKEILPQVIRALTRFGVELYCINVGAGAQDECPGVQVPPFELAIDAFCSDDPSFKNQTNIFIRRYAEIAVEKADGDKTPPFFIDNGRLGFHAIFVYLLIFDPENVTPTRIWVIASDLQLAVRCLQKLASYKPRRVDAVISDGQRAASTLLSMHKDTPKYLPQFLNKITIGLACYDTTGPLKDFGKDAVARISDMRRRQMLIASMTPLSNLQDMRVHTSFIAFNFFMAAKVIPNGVKTHGIIDEFTTLNLPGFSDEMLALRGLGVSAEMYIQSRIALENRVGEHHARVIFEQSDVVQMSGLSFEDAKFASEVLGTRNVRRQNANVKGQRFEEVGFNFQDQEEPLFTTQELMALPNDEQIVLIRSFRPDHQKKVPYWLVDGLKQLTDENPLEGTPPDERPVLALRITRRGVKVRWWRKPKGYVPPKDASPRKERLLQPSSFLWLYVWIATFVIAGFEFKKPIPHIYFEETAQGCEYVDLSGNRIIRPRGVCPPIWIKQGQG